MTCSCFRTAKVYAVTASALVFANVSYHSALRAPSHNTVRATTIGSQAVARRDVVAEARVGDIHNSVNSTYEGGMA